MKKSSREATLSGGETDFPYRLSTEGDTLQVVAEFPGIREEMIRLDLEGKVLTISVNGGGRGLTRTIVLPWKARLGKKQFRKGVLSLTLEKPG